MKRILTISNAFSLCIGILALVSFNSAALAQQPDQSDAEVKIDMILLQTGSDKSLRVQVVNTGQKPSEASRLLLTIEKINGVTVKRQTHVNVPALAAGTDVWLVIDAKSILPNNVSLKSTTYKLTIVAIDNVAESNEINKEVDTDLAAETTTAGQPETTDTQLTVQTPEQKKLGCLNVSRRWQVCGNTNFKNKLVAGVGIRFNRLDRNGKIVSSRSYKDCSKLAADQTIPAEIREKAAAPCKQTLQLATTKAEVP